MKVHRPVAADIRISSNYGPRVDPVTNQAGAFHYGVDFATPVGTPVVAAYDGKIYKAGWQDEKNPSVGFGQRVWQTAKIDGKDVSIFYAHLSELAVKEGDMVAAGTRVGLSGNTGKSSGPHLHFQVRLEGSGRSGEPIEFL
jgi:murein DD-endopeptidase MepM/ murein hydrolase activator NlpD